MPVRATKRGAERTPLEADWDVVICGASFAGLAVARELRGSGARVLVVDRYEIGERQTSACAAPTEWLVNLGLERSIRQTFRDLVVHAPARTFRWTLPWTFSTFDYRELCALLGAQGDFSFETATVSGRTGFADRNASGAAPGDVTPRNASGATAGDVTVHTDRGDLCAPLVVDALGWRRVLGGGANVQPPEAFLSRGLEVHPDAAGRDLELWLDPKYVRAGYAWSFPADGELRVGVGSFDPRDHVKQPTVELARDVDVPAVRFQGNWIPHRIRAATDGDVFFAGDSAGHCLPTTAEGIRTALYFGLACGRELRAVVAGERKREEALARYASFSRSHAWKFGALLRTQDAVGRLNPTPLMTPLLRAMSSPRLIRWAFGAYLAIAPPSFALEGREPLSSPQVRPPAAALARAPTP
ncbi:MAG TPA: NAD(P)/FAD-dependent oxidoreductase [Solirubrobacteraceae bacterium]|nr:NAD(P)/FAD-dependent oxidoreductase [Solirubrobacteraceae bacterium]